MTRTLGCFVLVLVLFGCGSAFGNDGTTSHGTVGAGPTITVFGAASLRDVLAEVERVYEAVVPGTTLTISTDSSAALATQIEQGAPADLFLSADLTNPQRLVEAGLVAGQVIPFTGNRLAIIVPAEDPGSISTPADLARPGVRIVAAGDEVPITRYAAQLVDDLAGLDGYPADFADRYAVNVVSKEDSVAGIVAKVELGEGDAGIVYVTDATGSGGVRTVEVPDAANVAVTYGAVIVAGSDGADAATAFLEWLVAANGQRVLAGSGFAPPFE